MTLSSVESFGTRPITTSSLTWSIASEVAAAVVVMFNLFGSSVGQGYNVPGPWFNWKESVAGCDQTDWGVPVGCISCFWVAGCKWQLDDPRSLKATTASLRSAWDFDWCEPQLGHYERAMGIPSQSLFESFQRLKIDQNSPFPLLRNRCALGASQKVVAKLLTSRSFSMSLASCHCNAATLQR
jgi:hypothetical protein